ncbi:hypothetical protein DDD_3261 [Nonlabens dokdonensis DSW-6]|uniref:Uncharacterized protein n=1 Tax=Nonlabens dokdonensis (strain DSM 17205 / KCTC 12402 / DSW-6) TaxID=592029 RepID=L7WHD9_NONDD|nr:hypothetical protein DDD_3261 [Nonlabens dokdonensis DSW-6]
MKNGAKRTTANTGYTVTSSNYFSCCLKSRFRESGIKKQIFTLKYAY